MKIKPVILCGGAGTRLWPKSKVNLPKQFIDFGGWTLFEKTLLRLKNPIALILYDESTIDLLARPMVTYNSAIRAQQNLDKELNEIANAVRQKLLTGKGTYKGTHAKYPKRRLKEWRNNKSLEITKKNRPDLLNKKIIRPDTIAVLPLKHVLPSHIWLGKYSCGELI